MLSSDTLETVKQIVYEAKQCASLQKAAPYIKELEFLSREAHDCDAEKINDVKNALCEYCKAHSDKQKMQYHLSIAIASLECRSMSPS